VPIKLLGIVPALAYNIVLPMLAALLAAGTFSVAFNLFRVSNLKFHINTQHLIPNARSAIGVGLLAVLFVVFIGNLGELDLILRKMSELGASSFRSTIPGLQSLVNIIRGLVLMFQGKQLAINNDWWYWNASRIMTHGEINEFRSLRSSTATCTRTLIAFPLTVLMLGIALGWAMRKEWRSLDALVSVLIGRAGRGCSAPQQLVGLSDVPGAGTLGAVCERIAESP